VITVMIGVAVLRVEEARWTVGDVDWAVLLARREHLTFGRTEVCVCAPLDPPMKSLIQHAILRWFFCVAFRPY